jgi:hypothetical protein
MTTHHLKCWPELFDAVKCGAKPFDVRKDDRGYAAGDTLVLHKWNPRFQPWSLYQYMNGDQFVSGAEQSEALTASVTYVLTGFGIEQGYVCMGIRLQAVQP